MWQCIFLSIFPENNVFTFTRKNIHVYLFSLNSPFPSAVAYVYLEAFEKDGQEQTSQPANLPLWDLEKNHLSALNNFLICEIGK